MSQESGSHSLCFLFHNTTKETIHPALLDLIQFSVLSVGRGTIQLTLALMLYYSPGPGCSKLG